MRIRHLLRSFIYEQHWTLGFVEDPIMNLLDGKAFEIHYVNSMPKDRWFADPFVLDYDENIIKVLVEEFSYKLHRGRIALLIIERNKYNLVRHKIILDLKTHLSFPFIKREDGKVYVYPENSESGSWTRYEYDSDSEQLINPKVVVNEPLTDAILTEALGEKLICSTKKPNQNGSELTIYTEKGEIIQEISFPSNIARNAGDWFFEGNKVYRPAQDCNGAYGTAVILQEVTTKDDGYFFKDVRCIKSTNPHFTTGCHTFNSYKGMTVVDVHGYRRPSLVKVANIIRKILIFV